MQYRRLGQTDLDVSSLGMGCVTFGREIDRATSFSILDHAWKKGITLFDTAEAYGNGASESILGEWLAERKLRDQIVLATKVAGSLTSQRVIESAEASLRRLQTDRIDLFQLHNWDNNVALDETLGALDRLVQQGKVRYCGCSNWNTWQIAKSLLSTLKDGLVRMETVQPPYNLVQREIESDLLPLCIDQQIGVISYSPLGAGFLTGKYQINEAVPAESRFDVIPGHQPIYFTVHRFQIVDRLRALAKESGHSMISLALAWVLRQPGLASVLIGARRPDHIDQMFDADTLQLPSEVYDELDRLSA